MVSMNDKTYLYCRNCGFHYPAGTAASTVCPECRMNMRFWVDSGDGPPPQPEEKYDDFGAPIDSCDRSSAR